jgi:hypothetical protein
MLGHPLVIVRCKEVTAIQLDGVAQRRNDGVGRWASDRSGQHAFRASDGGLELRDIDPRRRGWLPAKGPWLYVEVLFGAGKRAPQVVEDVPEIRACLPLGGVGPQSERDVLSRLRAVAVEDQVCQERFGATRAEWRQQCVAEPQFDASKQSDGKYRRHDGRLGDFSKTALGSAPGAS